MLRFEKLRAPVGDGDTLLEPSAQRWASLIEDNQRQQKQQAVMLAGVPVEAVRQATRRLLLGPQAAAPVIATGHQPAFVHPGVWAKHVVVHQAAQRQAGIGIDLVVDHDAPPCSAMRVPVVGPDQLTSTQDIPFSSGPARCPYEGRPPLDQAEVAKRRAALNAGLSAALGALAADTVINQYMDGLAAATTARDGVEQHWAGRDRIDLDLDLEANLREVRVSDAFGGHFLADLLVQAGRFARAYNQSLHEYRRREQVRGVDRPLPDLGVDGERIETALWIYQVLQPRRRLWVSARGNRLECYADRTPVGQLGVDELCRDPDAALATLRPWVVRPRALTLTLWARLLACDLFVHGIGGAKYDRITDGIFRRYLACEPPAYVCVSATLRLPLHRWAVSLDDWWAARRRVRDLHYNPQRYLANPPAEMLARRQTLIEASDRLWATRGPRPNRQRTFLAIRQANAELAGCEPGVADHLAERLGQVQRQIASNQVADDRDFFYALQPRRRLAKLAERLRDQFA